LKVIAMDEPITTSPSRAADSRIELELQFQTFAILWSLASLFVVWQRLDFAFTDPIRMLIHGCIVIAAIGTLVISRSAIPVGILGGLHFAHAVFEMPKVTSAELLLGFFGLAILISYGSHLIVNRTYNPTGIRLYRSFVPPMRIMVILSLFAIGVSRLNWGFLDLASSPATETLTQIRGGAVSDWVVYFTISLLVVVDGFIAIALLVPSLRRFAVGFGSCYFCWQAWMGFGEAQYLLPVLLVGLCLFTSTESSTRFYGSLQRWLPIPALRASGLVTLVIGIAIIAVGLWSQNRQATESFWLTRDRFIGISFACLVAFWLTLLLTNLIDYRPKLTWVSMAPRNVAHYALLVGFILYLASPYLGLGDVGRLTPYSGLASAGLANNHLFIPQASLTKYDHDFVEILDSSDPYLAQLGQNGMKITWFDLVNYLNSRPNASLDFVRGGQRFRPEKVGDIDVFCEQNAWWARKLLQFQPIHISTFDRLSREKLVAQP